MSELKNSRTELIELANNILTVRSEINTDRLNGLFTEVSFIHYNILKRIWPELLTGEECPKSKITLKSLYAETELRTSQVSQMAEQLSNNGLVSWERGEVGTYIMLALAVSIIMIVIKLVYLVLIGGFIFDQLNLLTDLEKSVL